MRLLGATPDDPSCSTAREWVRLLVYGALVARTLNPGGMLAMVWIYMP